MISDIQGGTIPAKLQDSDVNTEGLILCLICCILQAEEAPFSLFFLKSTTKFGHACFLTSNEALRVN